MPADHPDCSSSIAIEQVPPCPRCGRLEHTRWDDDPLPPLPALEVDGATYVELSLVRQAIRAVRDQADPTVRMTLALLHEARRAS
jgi:hypothetical protein